MSDCVFCKIAAGEIPSEIVYQDEVMVAFRDINPAAPTHLLLIPREHVASVGELGVEQEKMAGHLMRVAGELAKAEAGEGRGYRVVANCGREAGQSVFHLHLHLLAGRALGWPPG